MHSAISGRSLGHPLPGPLISAAAGRSGAPLPEGEGEVDRPKAIFAGKRCQREFTVKIVKIDSICLTGHLKWGTLVVGSYIGEVVSLGGGGAGWADLPPAIARRPVRGSGAPKCYLPSVDRRSQAGRTADEKSVTVFTFSRLRASLAAASLGGGGADWPDLPPAIARKPVSGSGAPKCYLPAIGRRSQPGRAPGRSGAPLLEGDA